MKKIGLFIMCFIAMLVLSNGNNSCCASNEAETTVASQTIPADISEAASARTAISLPKLIDFGSKQCRACKAMEPVLDSCKEKHADKFITEFIDVWLPENQLFAKSHNVQSIPTQVFFDKEGKEVFRNTGFISEDDIVNKFNELGLLAQASIAASETEKIIAPADESTATDTNEAVSGE
jgi:thioredoxin 1